MSVQTELDRLNAAKNSLKTAIESKGVAVPTEATLDTYSTLVEQISSGVNVQSDYAQNDPEQPDYIKNRPFYAYNTETTLVDQIFDDFIPVDSAPGLFGSSSLSSIISLELGNTYKVTWDNVDYTCIASPVTSGSPIAYIGDLNMLTSSSSNIPFLITDKAAFTPALTTDSSSSHTVKIVEINTYYNTIGSEFIPEAGVNQRGGVEVISIDSAIMTLDQAKVIIEKLNNSAAKAFWRGIQILDMTINADESKIGIVYANQVQLDYSDVTLNYPLPSAYYYEVIISNGTKSIVESLRMHVSPNINANIINVNKYILDSDNKKVSLPNYSDSNNSQFLQIVNGVPTWSSLPIYNGEVE